MLLQVRAKSKLQCDDERCFGRIVVGDSKICGVVDKVGGWVR